MGSTATLDGPKYRAPALAKGLEILELLAVSAMPISTSDMSTALGRSVSEIFRMLQVLEERGYIGRSDDGYSLTNRLFMLGMAQPRIKDIVSSALPVMQQLAAETGQSCHLAVPSGAEMVVVAATEAPGLLGFSVRIGYRRPLHRSASGRTLLAFQDEATRTRMIAAIEATTEPIDHMLLASEVARLHETGHYAAASPQLNGITDLSFPVLDEGVARAALTIPFANGPAAKITLDETIVALGAAAIRVSRALAASD